MLFYSVAEARVSDKQLCVFDAGHRIGSCNVCTNAQRLAVYAYVRSIYRSRVKTEIITAKDKQKLKHSAKNIIVSLQSQSEDLLLSRWAAAVATDRKNAAAKS